MKRILLPCLVLILSVLACSLPGQAAEPPFVTEPPVVTEPPTEEPPILIEPPLPTMAVPSGFMVTAGTGSISFYSPDGGLTGSIPIPGAGTSFLHAAGGTSSGLPTVIYFDWRTTAQVFENTAGVETVLFSNPEFTG